MCSGGNEEGLTIIGQQRRSRKASPVGNDSVTDESEAVALLLTTGFNGGEDTLDKKTALSGMRPKGEPSPNDGMTQGTLSGIVGRFNASGSGKSPEGRFEGE